jgi:hypothetical protein
VTERLLQVGDLCQQAEITEACGHGMSRET